MLRGSSSPARMVQSAKQASALATHPGNPPGATHRAAALAKPLVQALQLDVVRHHEHALVLGGGVAGLGDSRGGMDGVVAARWGVVLRVGGSRGDWLVERVPIRVVVAREGGEVREE